MRVTARAQDVPKHSTAASRSSPPRRAPVGGDARPVAPDHHRPDAAQCASAAGLRAWRAPRRRGRLAGKRAALPQHPRQRADRRHLFRPQRPPDPGQPPVLRAEYARPSWWRPTTELTPIPRMPTPAPPRSWWLARSRCIAATSASSPAPARWSGCGDGDALARFQDDRRGASSAWSRTSPSTSAWRKRSAAREATEASNRAKISRMSHELAHPAQRHARLLGHRPAPPARRGAAALGRADPAGRLRAPAGDDQRRARPVARRGRHAARCSRAARRGPELVATTASSPAMPCARRPPDRPACVWARRGAYGHRRRRHRCVCAPDPDQPAQQRRDVQPPKRAVRSPAGASLTSRSSSRSTRHRTGPSPQRSGAQLFKPFNRLGRERTRDPGHRHRPGHRRRLARADGRFDRRPELPGRRLIITLRPTSDRSGHGALRPRRPRFRADYHRRIVLRQGQRNQTSR